MALHVVVDERTEREHRQPPLSRIVQGERDQPAAESPPLELFVDLGVYELDQAGLQAVLQEAGRLAVDLDLIPFRGGVVGDRDLDQGSSSKTTSNFSTEARSPMSLSPLGGDIEFSVSSPWR